MKKVFLYISIGIILLAIPATILLVSQNQEVRKRAAPATTLSLSPSVVTTKAGDDNGFDLDVKIDTGTNQVVAIQIVLLFDPTKLQASPPKNGPLTPSILISGTVDPIGKATIKVGAESTTKPIVGVGTVATIHMKALAGSATPVSVRFAPDPDTYASALQESGTNVLTGTIPANITILNADGTQSTDTTTTSLSANQAASSSATFQATSSANLTGVTTTPTPTLEPTDTIAPTTNASTSAVTITSITPNESVNTGTPVISGKGAPGSTITIIIHSDPQTAVVTVDANGNWVYTPTTPLDPGSHTVEAMATDPTTGQTQTATTPFVVASGDSAPEVSTGSAIPATGNFETTVILLITGVIFSLVGVTLPLFIQ